MSVRICAECGKEQASTGEERVDEALRCDMMVLAWSGHLCKEGEHRERTIQ